MKILLTCLVYLFFCSLASATEVVGWKCPLFKYAFAELQADGIAKLETPPESSPFFEPGDELWDLSKIPEAARITTNPSPEWIVWNATSGRVISKADINIIWQLDVNLHRMGMPRQCRFTADVFLVAKNGNPLSDETLPAYSLSWISRSGQLATCASVSKNGTIQVKCEATLDCFVDAMIEATYSLPGTPKMTLKTYVALSDGAPQWVARDSDEAGGLDFRLTARQELTDGTPLTEAALILRKGELVPFEDHREQFTILELPDGGWLGIFPLSASAMFSTLESREAEAEIDPFAEPLVQRLGLKKTDVPDNLKPWFPGEIHNLTEHFQQSGISLRETSGFAGYSPQTERVCVFSMEKAELEKAEQLMPFSCHRAPGMVAVKIEGVRASSLITRAGRAASLIGEITDKKLSRSIEIEPTIGDFDDIIDLRLLIKDENTPIESFALNTSMTLQNNIPLEFTSTGGKPKKITASVERLEFAP
ncbi:MAG: hypothetical protein NWT08_06130 [Akkermansiaceae bacterium]|nr:hypothetical protein [Akkermansiaceae bacterium]MDP4645731.1 hypothetical protein [Akkermansiaceae bacterium]MDP4720573.1 hypothetical protein [Akkermansiaceae bacterium]MDP4781488.1 hypothetical protein [Akkermansiaceae bacterium]MDP4847591.1 hypothetical protein [Akkermansiaceae bacterium]